MSSPSLIIILGLEAKARIVADALTESEWMRLVDWIESHPEYKGLLELAIDLVEAERAA